MRGDTRGQSLHDFAIGMVIFLLVLGYVFAFIPSMFEPFTSDSDSSSVRADRTADYLTQRALAVRQPTGEGPKVNEGVLDVDCTEDFFNDTFAVSNPPCPFSSDSLRDFLGLSDHTNVYVAMYETVVDMESGTAAAHPANSSVTLAVGPEPNVDARQAVRAVRIVTFDGRHYHFVVRIW